MNCQAAESSLDVKTCVECYYDIEDCVQSALQGSFETGLGIEEPEILNGASHN